MANAGSEARGGAVVPGDRPWTRAARATLWVLVAALAARQVAVVLRQPPGRRLTDLETWTGPDGVLHVSGSLYAGDAFTGTPFGGLVLKPLTRAAEEALGIGWTFGMLVLVAVIGLLVAHALPRRTEDAGEGGGTDRASGAGAVAARMLERLPGRPLLPATPVAICLLMLSLPVRSDFHLGQPSIIPVLLVLAGCLAVRDDRGTGLLVGLAAAFQPSVLLFAALLWLTGRVRAATNALAVFAACTALAWIVLPADSRTYWVHHLGGVGLGAPADTAANQSLHGALLRLGLSGPVEIGLLALLAAAVVAVGLRRAARYAADGQLLLAVAVTGCVAVAVAPTAWPYQMTWVLLALVGRVGARARDRYVWPVVVVLVMTLPASTLLPNMTVMHQLRDSLGLLLALAAACAVPFLSRTSPYFSRPLPHAQGRPVPARFAHVPLAAPVWRRLTGRPNLITEILVIRLGYSAYSHVRLAVAADPSVAEAHGREVLRIERLLHIDVEHWANHLVAQTGWLRAFLDFYYDTFHFAMPLTILAALYAWRPSDYRWARTSLAFTTMLALIGFRFFPLAPPRLMPGLGFVDTAHGPQDLAHPTYGAMTALTNQYAAMPSLHFGWSLWCGLTLLVIAPKPWMKLLALIDPLCTLCAIIGTANHWVLDVFGGATVTALGFGLTYLLGGPRRLLPLTAPDDPFPAGGAEAVPAGAPAG